MSSAFDAPPKQSAKSPGTTEIDTLVDSCIHCGLCVSVCPTYQLTHDEREGPRGRIDLIRYMLAEGGQAGRDVQPHLDRCVPCWACMTPCPAKVDIRRLFDLARMYLRETQKRPIKQRVTRDGLANSISPSGPTGLTARASRFLRPARQALAKVGIKGMEGHGALPAGEQVQTGILRPRGKIAGRVALFFGCAQQAKRPQVGQAALRLLSGHGFEVVMPEGHRCCGAVDLALGDELSARGCARENVDVWTRILRDEPLDAIVTTTPSCALRIKEYGKLLSRDQGYGGRAERVGALVRDVADFLSPIELRPPRHWSGLKIAYHSSCSENHGLGHGEQTSDLLRSIGYTVTSYGAGDGCCGAAGFFNVLQPEDAVILRDRMVAGIQADAPDILVTSDPACLAQFAATTALPVVHTAELIDWTLGGPCPKELETLADNVHKVVRATAHTPSVEDETETTDGKRRWRLRKRAG